MTNDEAVKLMGLRVAKYRKLKKLTVKELGKKCNLLLEDCLVKYYSYIPQNKNKDLI